MRHDELADSQFYARTRRNIAGGAEGKHLQGLKLEGESCRFPPHAPAHYLPHRRPPISIRLRPRAMHWHLCAHYACCLALSPVRAQPARRGTHPARTAGYAAFTGWIPSFSRKHVASPGRTRKPESAGLVFRVDAHGSLRCGPIGRARGTPLRAAGLAPDRPDSGSRRQGAPHAWWGAWEGAAGRRARVGKAELRPGGRIAAARGVAGTGMACAGSGFDRHAGQSR